MPKRSKFVLLPRSFLPTVELDRALTAEARARGTTTSQLIRHALTEWMLYQGGKNAAKLMRASKKGMPA